MNSTTDHPTSSSRRIGAMALIIFLSVVLPFGILAWSIQLAVAGKPFGRTLAEFKDYESGVLKNDELWFLVYRPPGNAPMSSFDYRIKRRNLQTGTEIETGMIVKNDLCRLVQSNDQLLAVSSSTIFRCDSTGLVKIAVFPQRSKTFATSLFRYDGRLTTVVETDDAGYRLLHLTNGEWVNGRKILLPGPNRVWYDDPQTNRKKLLPSSCPPPSTTKRIGPGGYYLGVVVDQQQIHLIFRSSDGIHGYRNGFEFAHEDEASASALRPENVAEDVSGWEAIPLLRDGDNYMNVTCDRHGLLSAWYSYDGQSYVIRRDNEGNWSRVADPGRANSNHVNSICVDAETGDAYLVDGNGRWSFGKFYPIEQDTILPARFTDSGGVHEYLARWRQLIACLACAWLVHQILLLGGIHFLSRRHSISRYQPGLRHVELASAIRRAGAFSVDALLLLILFIAFLIPWRELGLFWQSAEEIVFCRILWGVESTLLGSANQDPYINVEITPSRNASEKSLFAMFPALFNVFLVTAILLCSLKVYVESRFGITPGKWLMGIRTVRSTLRPCGFGRALVRDTLYCLDVPLCVTAIPAAISMMLSKSRQRLGDRMADTVVVTAASLNESQRRGDDQQRLV